MKIFVKLIGLTVVAAMAGATAQASCLTKAKEIVEKRAFAKVGGGKVYKGSAGAVAVGATTGIVLYNAAGAAAVAAMGAGFGATIAGVYLYAEIAYGRASRAVKLYSEVEAGDGPALRKLYAKLVRYTAKEQKFVEYKDFVAAMQKGNADESLCASKKHMTSKMKTVRITAEELGITSAD